MTRLRVGVVGAGAWGRNHVRSVAGLADAELAAVCDVDAATRERIGRLSVEGVEMRMRVDHLRRRRELPPWETAGQPA